MIAISLLVDAPEGLREGLAATLYEGAKATLLGGFWVQLASGVTLVVSRPSARGPPARRTPPGPPRTPGETDRRAARRGTHAFRLRGWLRRGGCGYVNAGRPAPRTRFHPERLLPYACIAAALALLASEFTTTFHLVPPGEEARCAVEASDRHHLALGVIALFAIGAVLVAVLGASRPAAIAVAIAGVAALLLFLVVDLPDANSVGTLGDECASNPLPARRGQGGAPGRLLAGDGRGRGADVQRRDPRHADPGPARHPAPALAGRDRSAAPGASVLSAQASIDSIGRGRYQR